jgi:hypothetical protein
MDRVEMPGLMRATVTNVVNTMNLIQSDISTFQTQTVSQSQAIPALQANRQPIQ